MRFRSRLPLILLTLLALQPRAFAQDAPAPASPPTTAFVDVNVLPMDGERERVLRHQTVIVRDGRIAAIAPAGRRLPVPAGARVVEGGGSAWLLPGLADMHNHVDRTPDLQVQLSQGVTTMLNMGEARNSFVGRTRAAVERGEIDGPRIFAALAVDGSPQYGHLVVNDADTARAATTIARANGYDFIKVYNNLSPAAFAALVVESKARGLPIVGHGITAVGLARQLEAGQAMVAHAEEFFYTFFPTPPGDDPNAAPDPARIADAIATLRRSGAYVVADLVTYRTIAAQWGQPEVVRDFLCAPQTRWLWPGYRLSWPEQGYARRSGSLQARAAFLARFVKAMDAAGIPLLSGTDAPDIPGLVPGFALQRNLHDLVAAGLTPYRALLTATARPGAFIARSQPGGTPFGIVSVGARADLLLVAANPLQNLDTLAQPRGVMTGGRWHDAAALQRSLQRIAADYGRALPGPVCGSEGTQ